MDNIPQSPLPPTIGTGQSAQFPSEIVVRPKLPVFRMAFAFMIALIGAGTGLIAALFLFGWFALVPSCNVSVIPLHGEVVTYGAPFGFGDRTSSDDVAAAIKFAEEDPDVKAIALEVDSPGGSPVAGEEIAHLLERTKKPTVAVIRGMGASAAYWAAIGAKRIFASPNSDIGSIGVTMSYIDEADKNKDEGLTYNELASGKFKDTGDPARPLAKEEWELLMRDIEAVHNNFVEEVARLRELPVETVAVLADGSTMTGERAKEQGLIDELGGFHEAAAYLKTVIQDDVEWCRW